MKFRALLISILTVSVACAKSSNTVKYTTGAADAYDYIVVGSGPGGGPLAARLAQAGFSVLLIDAGDDHGTDPLIQVPVFHLQASEYTPIHWQYFVSHFDDPAQAQKDSKFTWEKPDGSYHIGPNPPKGSKPLGIYYPRTGTLGGCAEHNAMVNIYPHDADWSYIAELTGDASWSPENMRRMFQRIENNQYLAPGTPGHGYDGYLDTTLPDLRLVMKDNKVLNMVHGAATAMSKGMLGRFSTLLNQFQTADINADYPGRDTASGLFQPPLSFNKFSTIRSGPKKLILDTANAVDASGKKKYKLDIQLNTLVTRVLFDNSTVPRAIGVEYLTGQSLYGADPRASSSIKPTGSGSFFAAKEVIVSGGAFNTPQILKLSGVGPKDELKAHDIPVVLDNPAVGTNMQDRYEVGVVATSPTDFTTFEGCTFMSTPDDPCYLQWKHNPDDRGPYATNGYVGVVVDSSTVSEPSTADLIVGGLPADFHGYFPGYSNYTSADAVHWTWLSLKAHSRNNVGTVTLRSRDPREVPEIAFKSWTVGGEEDLQASLEGIQLARKMFASTLGASGFKEEVPGPNVVTDEETKEWIKNEAWGHHASCTVPIGSVLDSKFRVKGVEGLRVVDASVFPKIPGMYIVSSIYMISEKAAQSIIDDAQGVVSGSQGVFGLVHRVVKGVVYRVTGLF